LNPSNHSKVDANVFTQPGLCVATEAHPPFTDPQVETPIQQRIRQAAASQGFALEFITLPWRRCVHDVRLDVLDGVVGVSDRFAAEYGLRIAQRDGEVDRRRALGVNRLVLFRRAGDAVSWDGQRYRELSGPVLTIGLVGELNEHLRKTAVAIEGAAAGPRELARMLLAGRGNLAADSLGRVQQLQSMPEFAGHLEILDPPLGQPLALLGIAPHLYAQYPQRIEALWDEYARLREAEEGPARLLEPSSRAAFGDIDHEPG
jgi:polar amino acid transport system substrate-binding protein